MNTFSSGFIGSHENGVSVMRQNGIIGHVCANSDVIEGVLILRKCTLLFHQRFNIGLNFNFLIQLKVFQFKHTVK